MKRIYKCIYHNISKKSFLSLIFLLEKFLSKVTAGGGGGE